MLTEIRGAVFVDRLAESEDNLSCGPSDQPVNV